MPRRLHATHDGCTQVQILADPLPWPGMYILLCNLSCLPMCSYPKDTCTSIVMTSTSLLCNGR